MPGIAGTRRATTASRHRGKLCVLGIRIVNMEKRIGLKAALEEAATFYARAIACLRRQDLLTGRKDRMYVGNLYGNGILVFDKCFL